MDDKTVCPKCSNTQGFGFGTCMECGWNYLDNKFHFIRVYVPDLLRLCEHAHYFIDKHEHNVRPKYAWQKPRTALEGK